jgi:alpha-1,2-mannosyltransferase
MVRAEPGVIAPGRAGEARRRRPGLVLGIAAAVFVVALGAYLADVLIHPLPDMLTWFDLRVYNHAGTIARQSPGTLYTWQLQPGIKFTYTPFAALVFAFGSLLPWTVLTRLMTVVSIAALLTTIWLTLRALGWRGQRLAVALLGIGAVALWTEPVQRGLHLGQVELLLMVLIVWDLTQDDRHWWKGAGIGVAAGIKLIPLIYIPYLVLSGKFRQAAVASGVFLGTILIGFPFLPGASSKYWLTGYFLRPRNVGAVGSLLNQSLLAMLTRADGSERAANPTWLALAAVIAVLGVIAAAMLDRRGRPVAGWVTCALTGLLVSPISWDHHWIWVVPVIVVLVDAAVRSPGAARWAFGVLAAGVAAVYGGWPYLNGEQEGVPHGLIGFFIGPHPRHEQYYLHGIQILSWNLFAIAGLVMFAFALAAAARAWRARRAPAGGDAAVT